MNSNTNNRRKCRHADSSDNHPTHCLWFTTTNDVDRCAPCLAHHTEQVARMRHAREVRHRLCRNGQTDDLNACRGRVADGNEHGLCGECETRRRQDALDEIFTRHNMSATAVGGGGASEAVAVVVQPAVEAVAVAVAPQAHDDCCCCLGNESDSWSRLMCGHEVCTPCLGQLQRGDITSRPSPDRYQIGECPNDVICPMCRAPSGNTDPVELHQRLDKYRKRIITMRDEHSRVATDTLRRFREENEKTVRECRVREARCDARDDEVRDLRRQLAEATRQLAEATRRPAKTCDGCSKPQEDDRVPYCNGCMTALYGETWARDNGLDAPAQKVGGGGGRALEGQAKAEARGEPMVVIPRHQPAVMVGGGGGGAPTPRRPCRCPDCETPKPTQRRCDGRTCRANNRDTPCCKRCQYCPACR